MHDSAHKADLQFRMLCKSWQASTPNQRNRAVKIATGHSTKHAIVSAAAASISAVAFIVFFESIGAIPMASISALAYFYGLKIGDFLFDAIVNITR